jgi:hypothetical protein
MYKVDSIIKHEHSQVPDRQLSDESEVDSGEILPLEMEMELEQND